MATPTNLPASFVSGEILTAANMNLLRGAFRVLQVVSTQYSTVFERNTNTFADTGITLNITTQSNTSKVLVIATIPCQKAVGNTENACELKLLRGTTDLKTTTFINYTNSNVENRSVFTDNYLDSPATLGTLTYKYQLSNYVNATGVATCKNSSPATITLMEISA
tara:strand:+ start:28 stop:522 length:495 start_codon:yes stop_codon:yes gene_type:complete